MIKKVKQRRWEKALAPNGNHHTHTTAATTSRIAWK
ncbi:hypothetical protein SCOR_32260 [Sulfidibacter corallicola]